jgi:oligopeptide/dipeptide ABC transporter ATP-binding protein
MTALLEIDGLVKEFPGRRRGDARVRAVDGVDLAIDEAGALGLVGESGSGKTTVARCVLGLTPLSAGTVRYAGGDLRREVQLVFQQPVAALDPRMRVHALVAEPLRTHRLPHDRSRIVELLGEVGLSEALSQRYPHELSGGQAQRVVIARALATNPRLLVLDEPTSALDIVVQAQILNLLLELRDQHKLTFLLISHDLSVVGHLSDRIAVMYLGRVVEQGPAADVLGSPRHPYTRALLGSRRGKGAASLDAPPPLAGETPPAWAVPSGCRFHTRCPLRLQLRNPPVCETVDPALVGGAHAAACHFQDAAG